MHSSCCVDGAELRLLQRRSRILGDVDPATVVAEGNLVDASKTTTLGLDSKRSGKVEALLLGRAIMRIEGAYAGQCLLEQGVIGVVLIGQVVSGGVLLQGCVHRLLCQRADLAVHGEVMVALEVLRGAAGTNPEVAIHAFGVEVAQVGQLCLKSCTACPCAPCSRA